MSREPNQEDYETEEEYDDALSAYEDYADAKYEERKDAKHNTTTNTSSFK